MKLCVCFSLNCFFSRTLCMTGDISFKADMMRKSFLTSPLSPLLISTKKSCPSTSTCMQEAIGPVLDNSYTNGARSFLGAQKFPVSSEEMVRSMISLTLLRISIMQPFCASYTDYHETESSFIQLRPSFRIIQDPL